ncbi:hypothetical protein B7R77_15310 [Ralstonia solanacearum K60]|uniref:Uncharacterized protein n=1 Tax=Ralstonia solanacearum K60 TaxID=1091042 RepID=A0AAP7ZPS2_RALSL|nr:hypothetical protein B7R77_15310 [Ralstonia solanacearum K60]
MRGDAEPEAEVGMEAKEAGEAPGKDATGVAVPEGWLGGMASWCASERLEPGEEAGEVGMPGSR